MDRVWGLGFEGLCRDNEKENGTSYSGVTYIYIGFRVQGFRV